MIYVRFIADNSWESRAIRFRTLGTVSHVEYVIDEGDREEYTFGARLRGGITHRPIRYCTPHFDERYVFLGIEASYETALKFDHRKYDWLDIADLLVGRHPAFYDPWRLICSTLVGYSNRVAWANGKAPALINPSVETWRMTPAMLYAACTQMVRKVQ